MQFRKVRRQTFVDAPLSGTYLECLYLSILVLKKTKFLQWFANSLKIIGTSQYCRIYRHFFFSPTCYSNRSYHRYNNDASKKRRRGKLVNIKFDFNIGLDHSKILIKWKLWHFLYELQFNIYQISRVCERTNPASQIGDRQRPQRPTPQRGGRRN